MLWRTSGRDNWLELGFRGLGKWDGAGSPREMPRCGYHPYP